MSILLRTGSPRNGSEMREGEKGENPGTTQERNQQRAYSSLGASSGLLLSDNSDVK